MTDEKRGMLVDTALKGLAFLSGAGAFIFSILGGNDGPLRDTYISWGVVCVAATTVIAYIESGMSRRALQARERLALEEARLQEEIVRSTSAAAIHLARIGGWRPGPNPNLDRARGRLDQAICTAAALIHPGSRAVFFAWNSGRFECTGTWPGVPKVVDQISTGDFGFPVLRHVLRTGGVFKQKNVSSYLDGVASTGVNPERAMAIVAVRAGRHEVGVLAIDATMDTWPVPAGSASNNDGYSDPDIRHLEVLASLLAGGLK